MILDALLYESIIGFNMQTPVVLKNVEEAFKVPLLMKWSESSSGDDCEVNSSDGEKGHKVCQSQLAKV